MYFLYLDMLHNYRNVDNSLFLKGAKKTMFSPFRVQRTDGRTFGIRE